MFGSVDGHERIAYVGPLPAELEALTRLSRPDVLARTAEDVDAVALVRIAAYHQLTGRLAQALVALGQPPERLAPFMQHLPDEHERTEQRFTTSVLPQLEEISGTLLRAGVMPTVLKGASLVLAGIVAPGARPMGDLDILIPRDAIQTAREALHDAGYRATADETVREWTLTNHYQDAPLRRPDRALPLDLHWHVQHPHHRRPFDVDTLRTTDLQLRPGGLEIQRLSDVDLLTHLCLHFLKDREQGRPGALGQLWDVHDVAARLDADDWADLAMTARDRQQEERVGVVLGVAHVLLDLPLPRAFPTVAVMVREPELPSFAIRRVLAPRPEHVQLLMVTSDVEYQLRRIILRVGSHIRRAVRAPRSAQESGERFLDLVRILALARRCLLRPLQTRSEMALDRWAHRLS